MTGQAVARTLLIIALIVTANAIKPFSVRNVTTHLLFSARSFAVVLPDAARSRFDHASYLAITLNNSFFEGSYDDRGEGSNPAPETNAIAMENQAIEKAEVIPVNYSEEPSNKRQVKAVKAVVRRVDQAGDVALNKRTDDQSDDEAEDVADDLGGVDSLIADFSETSQAIDGFQSIAADAPAIQTPISDAVFSVDLPAIDTNLECALSKIRPIRIRQIGMPVLKIDLLHLPKRTDCETSSPKEARLIALVESARRAILINSRAKQTLDSILDCEDEPAEGEIESAIEATTVDTRETRTTGPLSLPETGSASSFCVTEPR